MSNIQAKKSYYQFQKEMNFPIYVAVDQGSFDPGLDGLLTTMKFVKLSEKEEGPALENMKKQKNSRCLSLTEATPMVARQIESTMESDRYGQESITPKPGYQVYRYKNAGIIVYSFTAKVWELGCFSDFGSPKATPENKMAARIILNRFLSWALAPHGVLGLWGVTVDEGVVLQRATESKGEAVFIDVVGLKVFSLDGVKKIGPRFKILRLDSTLKGRNVRMSSEELLSFVSAHCAYFDYTGLSVPVRQMIQLLSRMSEGLLHPEESFRPRTDLSL